MFDRRGFLATAIATIGGLFIPFKALLGKPKEPHSELPVDDVIWKCPACEQARLYFSDQQNFECLACGTLGYLILFNRKKTDQGWCITLGQKIGPLRNPH